VRGGWAAKTDWQDHMPTNYERYGELTPAGDDAAASSAAAPTGHPATAARAAATSTRPPRRHQHPPRPPHHRRPWRGSAARASRRPPCFSCLAAPTSASARRALATWPKTFLPASRSARCAGKFSTKRTPCACTSLKDWAVHPASNTKYERKVLSLLQKKKRTIIMCCLSSSLLPPYFKYRFAHW
jgi:hypothetical protein